MIGTKLADRYEIVAELGRGGMGVVYRARDPLLRREVAVKLIVPLLLTPEAEERFRREAQLVAQMDHPGLVPIYDFGQHEGSLFFVMPIIQGSNLRLFLREAAPRLDDVLEIGIQVAEALDHSHTGGVVHRDVKPENIMVWREDGGTVRVRVMDFGLARSSAEVRITQAGALIGTLTYLSPEQVVGKEVDARSDIYSLGTVLYECVAGEPPFSGEVKSLLYRILHELPQPPRALGASIDEEIEAVILACLAKEPPRRPRRASEVAEALKAYRARLRDVDRAQSVMFTQALQVPRAALAFVGRAREFTELQHRLHAAIAGECQFAVVSGEPGIGKSRLLDEFEKLARVREVRVLRGRCVEPDRSFPYQGFCEVIQDYFRLKEGASSPAADLQDIANELVALFPVLTEIGEIRSAASGDSKPGGTIEAKKAETRAGVFELLARTLTRLAGGKPLIVFLEDLHKEELTIEALQYIVRRLGPTPVLVVATYPSTEVDSRHPLHRMLDGFRGDRRFLSLSLGPFSQTEQRLFLETLVGGAQLSDDLVERLYARTEGNPFFTKELVLSLLDTGGISKDEEKAWGLSGEAALSPEALPATIQEAVEALIKGLPEDLRELLSVASVIGKTFDSRNLEALASSGGNVEEAIERLLEAGLIEEQRETRGEKLGFSSGVVRDVLYAALPRRKRRSLHRRYAEQLEQRYEGRLKRVTPELVYHFSQGDVAEKTVEYGLRLAKTALGGFASEEAARSARTALEFLDEEWEGDRSLEGEARLLLAEALRMGGDIDGALKEAEGAAGVFEAQARPARAAAALLLAAETAWQGRRTEQASRCVQRGLEAGRAAAEAEALRQLLTLAATVANLRGEYATAGEYLAEAERLGPESREPAPEEEVPRGGRLVVAFANPVVAKEPVEVRLLEEWEVLGNVFETPLATDPEGNLLSALCERWEVRDEGRSFLLTLRGEVRFHDGHLLTAEEAKTSFERAIRSSAPELPAPYAVIRGVTEFLEGGANEVSGIRVHSVNRLEIQILDPLPIYPALLTDLGAGIVRTPSMEGAAGAHPIGTGPFRIAVYERDRIVLERNPHYWRAQANLDALEFRHGLTPSAIAAGFRSGEFDLVHDLPPEEVDRILKDPRLRRGLVEAPRKNTYFVACNCRSGPVARDLVVRQALLGVVRTRDLVWRTLGRYAEPAACLIPPGMLGNDPGRRRQSLSLEEAREMLRPLGAGPLRLRASVHPLIRDRYGSLLTTLLSIWAEIGAEVSIETPTVEAHLESKLRNEGLDVFIGRWIPDFDDPDNFTYGLFHSRTGVLRNYFSSAETDQILEEARSESRPAQRETLYRRFENHLLELAAVLPLFHDNDYRLASDKVRGLTLRSSAPHVNYAALGKAESAPPSPEPRRGGGTLRIPLAGPVNTLDPALTNTIEQSEVLHTVFETLTRDAGGFRVLPWLASEVRVEDGGRRYRFRLRDDVRFHDGRRLTARDVRYSYERLLQKRDSEGRWLYSAIAGAKALMDGEAGDLAGFRIRSANEFTIELEEPISFFPAMISYAATSIVPEGSDRFEGSWREGCVGTGPFRVVKFEPGGRLELERNPSYWHRGYPRSEALAFEFCVPPKDIVSAFRSGRFSLAWDLFPADVEVLRREADFASGYREAPSLSTYFLAFNRHKGPLADAGLRQRLVREVDVARLVRKSLGRLAIPAQGLIPPGLLGHDSSLRPTPHPSPAPEQPPLDLELTAAVNPVFFRGYSALAKELIGAFREKGVNLRVVNETVAEVFEALREGSVDVAMARWIADYPDAHTFVQLLHSQEGILGRFCGSPETDRLIERGQAETDPALRHSLYREVEEIVAREALLRPLFHDQAYRFARPEVEGLSSSFWGNNVCYEGLRVRG